MGTCIVLAGLLAVVFLAVRSVVKEKKQGRAGCGGDCSRCRGCH